jgi:hypothetical protein
MLKIIALVFTAIVACTAIGTWAAANSRTPSRIAATSATPIAPLVLMQRLPSTLPQEQYDAY